MRRPLSPGEVMCAGVQSQGGLSEARLCLQEARAPPRASCLEAGSRGGHLLWGWALRLGVQVPLYTVTAPRRAPYFSSGRVLGADVSLQGLLHMDNSMGPWADGPQWSPALGGTQGGQGVDGPSSDLLVAPSPTQQNS